MPLDDQVVATMITDMLDAEAMVDELRFKITDALVQAKAWQYIKVDWARLRKVYGEHKRKPKGSY